MRVWGNGSGSGLLQLGLRRNDVITHVNGHPIDSSAAAQRALNELSSGAALKVTVERNGAPEDISLTFVDSRG
jgi:S1-C subfamily serine protease